MNEMNPNHLKVTSAVIRPAHTLRCWSTANSPSTRKNASNRTWTAAPNAGAELERDKTLHAAFDAVSVEPPASLLRECRMELAAGVRHEQAAPAGSGRMVGFVRQHAERSVAAAARGSRGAGGARVPGREIDAALKPGVKRGIQ